MYREHKKLAAKLIFTVKTWMPEGKKELPECWEQRVVQPHCTTYAFDVYFLVKMRFINTVRD
jgi:hypothetical protein